MVGRKKYVLVLLFVAAVQSINASSRLGLRTQTSIGAIACSCLLFNRIVNWWRGWHMPQQPANPEAWVILSFNKILHPNTRN